MKTLITASLIQDGDQIQVKCDTGEPDVALAANQVETLIQALATLRENMQPPITTSPPLGKTVPATVNPAFWTEPNVMLDGSTLLLRHPGLGWLAFALPTQSLQKLNDLLYAQMQKAQEGPGVAN